jgi:lipopolysaccharide export system permease protein
MKKLIFINFLKDVLIFLLMSLIIFGLIVWTLQAVNYFDFVTEDGHGLKVYFGYTFLNFPKIIHRILPFVFFISLYYTIIKYEADNKLNIFWINGISKKKFMHIVLIFSFVIMLIQIILGSFFSPISQLKARNLIKESNTDYFINLIKEGKFINIVNGLTIFIEKKTKNSFSNIFIEDSTKGYNRMIISKNGKISSDTNMNKEFLLLNGQMIKNEQNRINSFSFDQINLEIDSFRSNSITQPKIQEINSRNLFNCLWGSNPSFNNECENAAYKKEIKQELFKRFYKPIYIPLIGMACSLLIIFSKFTKNHDKKKKYIFLLILIIIILSETSLRYSSLSVKSSIIYLITPILIFFTFYSFFVRRINYA